MTVHHIAMHCINLREQERFYREQLGFRRARVFKAGTPNEFFMLRLGNVCIELFPTPGKPSRADKAGQSVGFTHLAFEVQDIEGKVSALRAAGVEMGNIVDCSDTVPGLRICFFKDPDGNVIELMEGWQDEEAVQ